MIDIKLILEHLKKHLITFQYNGRDDLFINEFSTPENIMSNSILWFKSPETMDKFNLSDYNDLLIVTNTTDIDRIKALNVISSVNSKEVFFSILNEFFDQSSNDNQSTNSIIESSRIGSNVKIGYNCYIAHEVEIDDDVVIKNNVVIEGKVRIGKGTIIHSGAIIGTDGYGYYKDESGQNIKIKHFGGVRIGQMVEIGSNTCIDRGTLGDTIIGNNVKIDNLCHIAHNVVVEDNVCIIALSMIAGSVTLKLNSYIAPSASIMNQITVGENSIVGLGAVVVKDVESEVVVAGVPAKVIRRIGG